MKDKSKLPASQLLNFHQDSYLERTSRPIYALIFLLPFIVFYELGTVFINTDILDQSQVRVVAFVWLQQALHYIGLGGKFAWVFPPFVVVMILIWLQITSRKGWRFFAGDILPMALECILLAIPLIVLSLLLNRSPAGAAVTLQTQNSSANGGSVLADVVTGVGAGIYEELIFRLLLICLLMILFQDIVRINHTNSIILAVLVSAALFSAHHHIVFFEGQFKLVEKIELQVFLFRTIAGVYFASLFAIRGFGITAGTHSFYDIIATIINAYFFSQH